MIRIYVDGNDVVVEQQECKWPNYINEIKELIRVDHRMFELHFQGNYIQSDFRNYPDAVNGQIKQRPDVNKAIKK